jgi:hypothetical protein
MSTSVWDVTSYSLVEVFRRFGETKCLHLLERKERRVLLDSYLWEVACFAYSSTVKMEAVRSSKPSVNFYETALCHNPQDRTRQLRDPQIRREYFSLNQSSNLGPAGRQCIQSNVITSLSFGRIRMRPMQVPKLGWAKNGGRLCVWLENEHTVAC